jgi:hypothetical protein
MTNANTDEHELEQFIARYMEDLEAGRSVDEAALKVQYAHLEPDLSEFLDAHRKFIHAAQAAREEIEAANTDTHSSREGEGEGGEATFPDKISLSSRLEDYFFADLDELASNRKRLRSRVSSSLKL